MQNKHQQISCYILHRRPYRETSAILDVVAEGFGRLSLIIRGVYNSKNKSKLGGLAQVFRPLLISFSGGGELKYVNTIENNGQPVELQQKFLYSGFYINELICRLWPQNIDSDELFDLYQQALTTLAEAQVVAEQAPTALEIGLRDFEINLLGALGYGIDCFFTCDTNDAIEPDQQYLFLPEQGFVLLDPYDPYAPCGTPFNGTIILAIGEMTFDSQGVRRAAKRLIRLALTPHLGHKPLKSRELFTSLMSSPSTTLILTEKKENES